MNLVHVNDGGMISKGDLISAFERLAKLVKYELTSTDLGELGYLWSVMDVNSVGELNDSEVKNILDKLDLTHKIK